MLRRRVPGEPDRHVVHETIYQAIYRPDLGGLRRDLPGCCAPDGAAANRAGTPTPVAPGRLVGMTMLDQRPAEASDRSEPGHWEGDLIHRRGNRSAIGTLVERSSRSLILLPLPDGKSADAGP